MSSKPDPAKDAAPDDVEVDDVTPEDEQPEDVAVPQEQPDSEPVDDQGETEPEPAEPEPAKAAPASELAPEAEAEEVKDETTPEVEKDEPAATDVADGTGPASSAQRLRSWVGRPSRSQALVGVLLAVLGFAAVTQVRSTELDDSFEGRREEELIEIFNGLTGTSERTRREISRLEQTRRELQVDTSARSAAIEQAEQRLRTLNILAGLVPVTGQGLRITITEEEGRISIDSLLDMVQELRTAGAEAMEFNGEVRLVASSSFDDVNGVIHLDGVPLTSPYVLEVIGESHTLRTGVEFPSGPVVNLREKQGADVEIDVLEVVDIESVIDLPRAEFAEPAEGQ